MHNFFKVWASVVISLSYCYTVGKIVPKGLWRLVLMLPVVSLFLLLPLGLDSVNLGGLTGFFVAWLANFKLLLFAFGKGPLAMEESSGSLLHFVVIACLPVKAQQRSVAQSGSTEKGRGEEKGRKGHRSPLNYAVKGALVFAMVRVYDFSDRIHPMLIYLLYCFHIYFSLEITLAGLAGAVRAAFGMELEPQFNEPHLSTSLQDFWSRRWNLMVPGILRPSVYEPVRNGAARLTGRAWAPVPAILAVFLVSGLMHELMFYYLQAAERRSSPPWDITGFFLLHGVCLVAEILVKKALAGRWQPPRLLSSALTCGFVIATGLRWFLPPMLRMEADKRGLEEYAAAAVFVRDATRTILANFLSIVKG